MLTPRLSVIVPTRDRPILLGQALSSVRFLAGADLEIELIVVNAGSSQGSRALAECFGATVLERSGLGSSAARNAGWRVATGDFVAFLDDDDVWTPQNIRPQLALITRRPDLAAAVGRVQLASDILAPLGEPYPEHLPAEEDVLRAFFHQHPQIGSIVARMQVRESVGFFNERLDSGEDWEWCIRLALQHNVGYVPVTSLYFRQRPVGTQDDLQWRRLRAPHDPFWRMIRQAGSRRPPAGELARIWLRHRGGFYSYFARSALAHDCAGDRRAMRTSLYRAVIASPLHAAYDLARGGDMRQAMAALVRTRRTADTPAEQ